MTKPKTIKPVKPIKAWAVAMKIDNWIPDFSISGSSGMKNIMQIHSDKKSAEKLAKAIGDEWYAIPVLITPLKKK